MKKRVLLGMVAAFAVTASVAAYYRVNAGADDPQYLTATPAKGDVVDTVQATGTLKAVTTVQVGTQVSGVIQSLYADFNSVVRKGQVIARLDPSVMQAEVEQSEATVVRLDAEVARARAARDDADVKFKRSTQLKAAGLIPAADADAAESTARQAEAALTSAQAQVRQAKAALDQSRLSLSHTVITAPVDGIVISRNVDVGQTVAASMSAPTLFVIAKDLSAMQVEASIDEADIGRIRQGQDVRFGVDAYPDERFAGVVAQVRLDPVVQQNVVSYITVINVPNPEHKLKPGMTATVDVEIARADNVLTVPNAALRFRPQSVAASVSSSSVSAGMPVRARGARVWTVRDGRLQPVPVETGITNGTVTAIVGGDLGEATPVVTGENARDTNSAASMRSPLIPQRPRPGQGGARGGSAARGGAAR